MKKTAALLLAAILLLSCTACASPEAQAATLAGTQPAQTPTTQAAPAPTETAVEAAVQETLAKDDVPVSVTSGDGLVTLNLPNQRWAELYTDEHTVLFSDGDCAIAIDMLKRTDDMPTIPLSDETHQLIFTSILSVNDYLLFITGYAHEETDFSPIAVAINSIRIDKNKVPQVVEEAPQTNYTVRECNNSAWVTANSLNVRAGSGTDTDIISALTKNTKVTVTGEVLQDGQYIGWSRIKTDRGTVGYVASQFLTNSQPQTQNQPTQTKKSKTLWSEHGNPYTLYQYSDSSWRTTDGTIYWSNGGKSWINSAGKLLYEYDPTTPASNPSTPAASPTKTGSSAQLWDKNGSDVTVYLYSDNVWRSGNGTQYWPDTFSTWGCDNGKTYYDYDPTYVEPTEPAPATPPSNWKETFEKSLYARDGMVACWYTYLGDGEYEVYCQDPDNPDQSGTVHVNAYTGGWNWA